jgi:hypothetical protein
MAAGDHGFRFGPADSQSGSAATEPVSATKGAVSFELAGVAALSP